MGQKHDPDARLPVFGPMPPHGSSPKLDTRVCVCIKMKVWVARVGSIRVLARVRGDKSTHSGLANGINFLKRRKLTTFSKCARSLVAFVCLATAPPGRWVPAWWAGECASTASAAKTTTTARQVSTGNLFFATQNSDELHLRALSPCRKSLDVFILISGIFISILSSDS